MMKIREFNPFYRPVKILQRRHAEKKAEHNLINWIQNCTNTEYTKAGITPPKFHFERSDLPSGGLDFALARDNDRLCVSLNQNTPRHGFANIINKIAAASYWFLQADTTISSISLEGNDGEGPSTAKYSYSTCSNAVTALPDPHFFRSHGYRETDLFAKNHALRWDDRSDKIVWRGRSNNVGLFLLDPAHQDNLGVMQRLRMAQKCKAIDVDFRFVDEIERPTYGPLMKSGLIGEPVPTHDWGGMKYAIDIDGYTNAWCNFLQRLKLGCCVLKVESQFGFRQWYYHKLTPWEHFVPICTDMSDLAERVDWVQSNPGKARAIAAAGQELARAMTFENETQVAAKIINTTEGVK
jgi:hypothetical protein